MQPAVNRPRGETRMKVRILPPQPSRKKLDMPRKKKQSHSSPIGRRFYLKRVTDVSGVSGIGRVAFGIEMPSGRAVIEWLTSTTSEGIYNSVDECIQIHGHGGDTEIEWIDTLTLVTKE